jgi:endonuclease G
LFDRYLPAAKLLELRTAALGSGLGQPTKREFLLADLPRIYAAILPIHAAPADQVLSDLTEMNAVEYLEGEIVPLAVWLTNAANHAVSPPLRDTFRKAREDVLRIRGERRAAEGPAAPNTPPPGTEKIVHSDDMLPYGFLRGGLDAGQSVARLLVGRFEAGAPALNSGGVHIRYFGTGWLIAPRYLVTNHHVVNARDEFEPNASVADLMLQAEQMVVQFDYDSDGAEGRKVRTAQLVAYGVRGQLDYAVVELAEDAGRPLRLSPTIPAASKANPVAVNIVQHPGGAAKQLGIRNNALADVTAQDLEYFTDTLGGSSGSPVLDDLWRVIGLHKLSRPVAEVIYQGKSTFVVNAGTRIDLIVADLQQRFPAVWAAING